MSRTCKTCAHWDVPHRGYSVGTCLSPVSGARGYRMASDRTCNRWQTLAATNSSPSAPAPTDTRRDDEAFSWSPADVTSTPPEPVFRSGGGGDFGGGGASGGWEPSPPPPDEPPAPSPSYDNPPSDSGDSNTE